jgi:hypothetical protein
VTTGCMTGESVFDFRVCRDNSLRSRIQSGSEIYRAPNPVGTKGSLWEYSGLKREADHSAPPKVKNVWRGA